MAVTRPAKFDQKMNKLFKQLREKLDKDIFKKYEKQRNTLNTT